MSLNRLKSRPEADQGLDAPTTVDAASCSESAVQSSYPRRLEPGARLGSYEVVGCIAQGGMATVWAARQCGARGFNRLVALKTVLAELSFPEFESMFVEEARIASRIHHPNVCEIFELIEDAGLLALSMEWVDGDTLAAVLSSCGNEPLGHRIAAHIISEVASGVHAAHEALDEEGRPMELIHRDVSPQNVLISRDGHVKVADFGVAKALASRREVTEAGFVKGKLGYMSPEQACGFRLDRRTDIFSIGIVLYCATLGRHPFRRDGEDRDEQLVRLLTGDIPPPSRLDPAYPPELEAIVMRALERRPEKRYSTAAAMRRELQEWLVSSGPLITEQDVAAMMQTRVGTRIEERARRIRRCLGLPSHADADSTFVPSTRPSSPDPGTRNPKGMALTTALGAAAVAITLGVSISRPYRGVPSTHVAAQQPASSPRAPRTRPLLQCTEVAVTDASSERGQIQEIGDAGTSSPKETEDDRAPDPVRKRPPRRPAPRPSDESKKQLPCKRWGI